MEMPPPGWYEDPVATGGLLRWWDGTQWTEHSAPAGNMPQAAIGRAPATEHGYRAIEGAPEDHSAAPAPPMLSAPVDTYEPASPAAPALPSGTASPPSDSDDPSLTDWFQSIPFPVVGRDTPATPDSTRVLERGGPGPEYGAPGPQYGVLERGGAGTLAEFGWPHGTPVTEDDTPLLERHEKAGMLLRNRTRLMWGLALGAAVAMLITGILVAVFGSGTAPQAAAAGHPSAVRTLAPKASASPPSTPSTVPTTGTPVTDAASGLSYATLSTPWTAGCPGSMSNAVFGWTAGENAVAGPLASAGGAPWYASACSGVLGQQYPYTGVADLPQTAMNLVGAFDAAYFSALSHVRSTVQNNPLQVSGHPGWIVEFQMTYPTAASQGLPWQAQLGAVVVVDRGTGQPPAVMYVTVPDNLGTANVGVILASMQLNAPAGPAAPASPAGPAPPASAAPPAAPAANGASPTANP